MDENLRKPFFSVIMPAYNAALYIREAIDSVISQEFQDWELIIIDDGSTDDTPLIISSYAGETRIRSFLQDNKRLGAARNLGISFATGSWISFLDADDLWLPGKLSTQYAWLAGNPEIDVLYSDGYTFDQEASLRLPYHFPVAKGLFTGEEMYRIEFAGNSIPILSACIRAEWCNKAGKQDELTRGAEDWDYWLRLALAGGVFYGLSQRLFVYRVHAGAMSAQALTQRYASALILIKNYRENLLPGETKAAFVMALVSLKRALRKNGRKQEASVLAGFIDRSAAKLGLMQRLYWADSGERRFSAKRILKISMLGLSRTFAFPLYRFYRKHRHQLAASYCRWQLGARLETRGSFFLSPTAEINIRPEKARLITYGLYIDRHTRITLDRDDSLFLTGQGVSIGSFCNFTIWSGQLRLGNNVSFNHYCSISCMDGIEVGDDTWFGEGVRFYDHNHRYGDEGIPFTQQGMVTGKIKVGQNCWIGSNTVILQNVTIGDNCVIGANNLIYKAVPANTIIKARAMELVQPWKNE